jgi:hypothetical protein
VGSITRALVVSLAVLLLAAPVAAADTLPGRDSPFTPSQAVADQYLGPAATPPAANPRQAAPSAVAPGAVGGVVVPGEGADDAGSAPVSGQAPALVERGSTAPGRPTGTLPFTGSDLLALVWIALALVAAGTVIEVARRRLEAGRARAGA